MAATALLEAVRTAAGSVEGVRRGKHYAFYGIPYAAAPVGEGRFKPAKRAPGWTGVRRAYDVGLAACQTPHPIPGFAASGAQGEDCLNLNIFTPAADGARRPVMVWVHGGAFTHGAGSEPLYDGGPLAERGDVVVVSFNYRLGALGFLRLPEIGAMGNAGLQDALAALRWVEANIAGFGGDPENVTLFGESAGSAAVGCLLAMPASKGLFRRTIMQSGAGRGQSPETADRAADRLLTELGLTRERAGELFRLEPAAILAAQAAVMARVTFGHGFSPVLDPAVLPVEPTAAVRAGDAIGRPILIGTNRDEMKLFAGPRETIDEAALARAVRGAIPGAGEGEARDLIAVYRGSRKARGLPGGTLDLLDAILSDVTFRIPSLRLAAAQKAAGGKAYAYLFTHESPALRGALGACHALEMPFVFGTLDAPTQDRCAGTGPDVERLSGEMMDAWLSFVRSNAPGHEAIGPWSPYEPKTRPTMVFGTKGSRQENDPFGEERKAIEALI